MATRTSSTVAHKFARPAKFSRLVLKLLRARMTMMNLPPQEDSHKKFECPLRWCGADFRNALRLLPLFQTTIYCCKSLATNRKDTRTEVGAQSNDSGHLFRQTSKKWPPSRQNQWPLCLGMGGRLPSEYPDGFPRKMHLVRI